MKSKFRKLLDKPITPEECFKPKYSKDYQIGVLVGEGIVHKLPTLSTDSLKTFNVINVPENLEDTWKIKEDKWKSHLKWFGKEPNEEKATEVFYENLKWYKTNLEKVYLPTEIKFIIYDFYQEEFNEDMIEGFNDSIWGCDLSHYVFSSAEISDFTSTVTIKMKYNE